MEKYYFNTMEDFNDVKNNWIDYGYSSSYTEEEIKKEKVLIDGIEYDLIPLSKVPEYLKQHPDYRIYRSTILDLDKESQKFLFDNINEKNIC